MLRYSFLIIFSSLLLGCNQLFKPSSETVNYQDLGGNSEVKNGLIESYTSDGRLVSKITFKNGVKDGPAWQYYKAGRVQYEMTYKDGKKDGKSSYFYQSGKLYRETYYKEGKMHGVRRTFREDGKLASQMSYKEGFPKNDLIEYTNTNKLKTNYPAMRVEVEDHRALSGQVILNVFFEGKNPDAEYYNEPLEEGFLMKNTKQLSQLRGMGILRLDVPKGKSIHRKLDFSGVFKTTQKNYYVATTSFYLDLD